MVAWLSKDDTHKPLCTGFWWSRKKKQDCKGDGKGKKGKEGDRKGGGKDHHGNPLTSKTPDGREICYAFNSKGCPGRCGRVHVCRVAGCYCYGDHSAREHNKYSGGEAPKKAE